MAQSTTGPRMGAGVAAAAVALGVVELTAAFFSPAADARTSVGTAVINLTPGPVKEWAIQTFGTADKLFLSVSVLAVIGVLAAVAATWERPRIPVATLAFVAAAVAGSLAVLAIPGARGIDIIPTLLGAVCGIAVLRFLIGRIDATEREEPERNDAGVDPGRRLSLLTFGIGGLGLLSGVAGAVISRRLHSVSGDRESFALPSAAPASPVPADVTPQGVQLPSFITSNKDFYRIDTALSVPQLARADFRLRIHGMVDREVTYTFDDLAKFEPITKVVTLTCVSNPVGGDLISNATWTGYRVADLLRDSGIHPDADMVLSTSVDGFTAGTPVEALTDARESMLAIGMNGVPLPVEHGYPARLVVPGLYGYVSATKWVVDLELTRFDRVQAYWTKLGWSERGPIKTESRIDVPRDGQKVAKGAVTFGGVAWAQNRGVKAVEVRIDDGPWQQAQLGSSYSNDTWRLWSFPWTATQGGFHTITARATDNTGAVQTEDQAPPAPDGATGWPTVSFEVA
ncbi:DMSO/TMAO reductase YedYZ molybdopterin-dependent catalytic subunit [Mycolicibacterium sp. BK556]|uniref:molybdopterin-dependent oxidoreductase n=1 Tax=unclassified Mycolicibacterium TaxID=2636767 RepID=UPI00160C7FBD|nr:MULTISPECIES: molybdopterin-dependent oxidoreductase [unclassified Mycolicibacterium]MBB3606202.1 DMSO/TMAO reductase YedYZ molybdopterin-dependent catalytic subunit [Mycolicibacterium sp. BK556]MBB3632780.1 DMSO/TMAO reductase YedYZ molybdopterin-dependent catalytic subunit [Mycolicibacterium sp. BK607]